MWRDVEPRAHERERAELAQGSRGGTGAMPVDVADGGRDPLTRELELPSGREREWVRMPHREYRLSGRDVRTMATVGAFRVVSTRDLGSCHGRKPSRPSRDVERLRDAGLVHTMPHVVGPERTTLVTLSDQGRALLEANRRPSSADVRQAFYSGVVKPRELSHDTRLYPAYVKAVERLESRGARVRRVVLEEELKGSYQRFLQDGNRGRRDSTGRPTRTPEEVQQWARDHQLPCEDGHLQFPDVRVEYEERDGRRDVEDLEVVTPHYRGAHAAAKVRAGFSRSGAVGARIGGTGGGRGGGRGRSRLAEEMLL